MASWSVPKSMKEGEKEKLFGEIEKTAHDYEVKYGGCAQCVLIALQEHLKLGNGEAFKAASAFAGGFANCGETCGALSGGMMAIGLAYGREHFEEIKKIEGWKILC